ncbi:DUF2255 family protein [Nonomuraea aridisoli]|uniref:DUF2255 domain-containing protein n=1 Tax=Nonomuraea aridisoli TaxID=2070368 RepID=A0A2W2E2I4_9ACTN|nr:DUF2255 family protein [Nonomuraea aridisoli]PZG18466.1 DUF2255 domain-containing protein [Nonomuraea aridisoli]
MPASSRTCTPDELDVLDTAYSVHLHAHIEGSQTNDSVEIGLVAVNGSVFVRAYQGPASRWYQATQSLGTGWIRLGPTAWNVAFSAVPASADPRLADHIDKAYVRKYGGLAGAATGDRMRQATIRVDPLTP